jgi:uncharacterized repeat protein (TIGR01451 family)
MIGLTVLVATFVVAALPRGAGATATAHGSRLNKHVSAGSFDGDLAKLPLSPVRHGVSHAAYGHTHGRSLVRNTTADALVNTASGLAPSSPSAPGSLSGPLQNFEGINNRDGVFPPDTDGDVGPTDYIQIVNDSFEIFDKQGNSLAGPSETNSLWSSFQPSTSLCRTTNNGDAVVRHDAIADRWVITQFAFNVDSSNNPIAPFEQCFAVSKTSDPVNGGWWTYDFNVSNQKFNDYGKLGIWPDGYYMSFNWDGDSGPGGAFAFDRADMLNGNPAGFICFGCDTGLGLNGGDNFGNLGSDDMLLPGDLDGATLPAFGAPETFMRFTGSDTLRSWAMHTDWQVPSNSTLKQLADVTVATFNSSLSGIPQPNTTQTLDTLSDRLMFRLQYRNFGDHESLVVNHSVNVDGKGHAGVRWYELRRSGSPDWSLYQQGTFAPDDANRWMGSIAMDKAGDMALGYSVASAPATPTAQDPNIFPSIRVTSRQPTDPLGLLPQGEMSIIAGGGSQTGKDKIGRGRWGDYSAMMLDPTDDCTFWYTQEYIQTTGNAPWQTRVASFRFPTCNPADLSITKTHSPDPATAGGHLVWHITVTNNGPNPVPDATVTDTLPAGVTYLSNTLTAPAGCTGAGTLTCTVGSLASGQSVSFDIDTIVDPSMTDGTVTNTATVTSATVFDPDLTNNTATDTARVVALADLRVSKLCKPDGPIFAGTPINCTVFVDNLGPSAAHNVVVDDVMLANGSFTVSNESPALGGGTPGCTLTNVTGGQDLTCSLGDLAPASSTNTGRATITYTVSATEGMNLNNVASVRSDTTDPNPANNSATVNLTIQSLADLSLIKTGPSTATAGTDITYNLTATNNGPSTATNVVIADSEPAGVQILSVTSSVGGCNAGVPGDPLQPSKCSIGTLAPAASATMTVTVHIKPDTLGTINDDARVSSDTFDADLSNNLATVATNVTASADLSITKSGTPSPVLAGNKLTYTMTVSNAGPSTAQSVSVSDTLPTGTSFVSGVDGNGNTICALVQANTVVCDLKTMDPGTSKTILLTVLVAPSVPKGTTLVNTATVTSATPDPDLTNNTTTASTAVDTQADIWLDKTGVLVAGNPSPTLTYTLAVHNNTGCETDAQSTQTPNCGIGGPSDAQSITVKDVLPLDYKKMVVQFLSPQCTLTKATNTVMCTAQTIPAGAVATFQIQTQVSGSVGTITNTATATTTTFDPNTNNNTNAVSNVIKGGTGRTK